MGGGGGKWGSKGAGQSGMAHRSNGGLADWPSVLAPRNVIRWPRRARGATYFRDIHHVHSSSFLIIPVQLSSCFQFGACQRGAGWPALGLGVSSKKRPLGQSPAGAKYTRHFRTPPYGHDGSLRFVTVFAHNGAVPVRSQVIHNFQEHPLLFGRRRAFRKGFPPTGPSSTDRRR